MKTLELSDAKGQQLDELETKAIAVVNGLLDSSVEATDAERAAVKVLGIVAKNRQTMTAREALHFNMAVSLSDPDQLAKYVQTTCPQLAAIK
jgi:hypothetical protein